MSLTDALGVKGNITQTQAAADEAIDRAQQGAGQLIQVATTDANQLANRIEDALNAFEAKLTAIADAYLVEVRELNASLAKFAALAEKIGNLGATK